jgi:hypothetical protein
VSRRLSEDCLSDLKLDRWLSGELSSEEAAAASSHAAQCLPCRARHLELQRDREAFDQAPPPLRLRAGGERAWVFAACGAAAAAAALGLFWLSRGGSPSSLGPRDEVASKGSPFALEAVIERAGHQLRARSGDLVSAGDRVQLAYSTPTPIFLYVVGVDGTKRATTYFPEGTEPSRVAPGSEVELPFSLVIDDTPGTEHFYGVACAEARAPVEVARAVEVAGSAPVLAGCEVATLRLEKRP